MTLLEIVRTIAILSTGTFAGILFGDRMGASFARPALDVSSFLQFQQVQHRYFQRLMPPLMLTAILTTLTWLLLLRAQWSSVQFCILAVAMAAIALASGLTLRVNIPINKQLMTWSVENPPANVTEVWSRWEKVHTIRTVLWLAAFTLEVVCAGMFSVTGA
jgi:hypothetical protein